MHRFAPALAVLLGLLLAAGSGCSPGDDAQATGHGDPECSNCGDTDTAPTCPDGLVYWNEYGVCAPFVSECEHPWEMPTVNGECVVVGPRACPKAWDPDSDADCEPGELLPCPEGFVLTEDEVACIPHFDDDCGEMEIPILGGGCKKVGPEWGEAGEPFFDECGEGFLALPGGGCVMVGPRACPKLWDPEADADCEVGDVLPCPEGWMESDDGLYCEPIYDDCGPGERPLLGGGCELVVPLPENCPAGPFPDIPEGASSVVHVLAASPCTTGCGDADAPFPDIATALATVENGGVIAVGEGTYHEGVEIAKDGVQLIGLCSAKVKINGTVDLDAIEDIDAAALAVLDASDVVVSGVRLTSFASGVVLQGTVGCKLTEVEVEGGIGAGMIVRNGTAELTRVWVHDVMADPDGLLGGIGVRVESGGNLTMSEGLVEGTTSGGIQVRGAGANLMVTDTTVRDLIVSADGKFGNGIRVQEKGSAALTRCVVERTHSSGIRVADPGSTAEVIGSVIRGTDADSEMIGGAGLLMKEGARAVVRDSMFEDNQIFGVVCVQEDTELILERSVVRTTRVNMEGMMGIGITAMLGAWISMDGCLSAENHTYGIYGLDVGTILDVRGTVVVATAPKDDSGTGVGLVVSAGAEAVVSWTLVEDSVEAGVLSVEDGTSLTLSNSVVRRTTPNPLSLYTPDLGSGIVVIENATLDATACLVEDIQGVGVNVQSPGGATTLTDCVVRENLPTTDPLSGVGVVASAGGQLDLDRCSLMDNRYAGALGADSGTIVTVSDSLIAGTRRRADNPVAYGVVIAPGAALDVSGSLLFDNEVMGVGAFGADTVVLLTGTVIQGTRGGDIVETGSGLEVGSGASAELDACLLLENTGLGATAYLPGTTLAVRRSVIRDTVPTVDRHLSRGLEAYDGAGLAVSDCAFEGNLSQDILVLGKGTQATVETSLMEEGVAVAEEGTLHVAGCAILDGSSIGFLAISPGTGLTVRDSLITDLSGNEDGLAGYGGGVMDAATADLQRLLVRGARTAGLLSSDAGTSVSVTDCAVLNTATGGTGTEAVYGDGLLAADGGLLNLTSSAIRRNERSGVYCVGGALSLHGTVISENHSYGLAMDGCDTSDEFDTSWIFGNWFGSPRDAWSYPEVTTSPDGLPVPPRPSFDISPAKE